MASNDDENKYQEYLNKTIQIRQEIDTIVISVNQIKIKLEDLLKITDRRINREKDACNLLIDETYLKAKKVKLALKEIEEKTLKQLPEGSTEARIVKNQLVFLSKKLIEKTNELNKAQEDYHQKWNNNLKRQLSISGITDKEEQDRILGSGNTSIFAQGVSSDLELSKQTLSDVQDRHNEIIKLEQNIKELHDMFVDMAVLVEEQGQTIDNIEYNVNQTRDHVVTTKPDLKKAVDYKRAARRKKIVCVVILLIVLLIIGIILAVILAPYFATANKG